MTAKSKRTENEKIETNNMSNLYCGKVVTSQKRPVTTKYTRKGESGPIAFKGTLARFTGFTKQHNEDTSNLSLDSESIDNFEKKFESRLKVITRLNSARTDSGTEKSAKTMTETCTELSEDTLNDFDPKNSETLESPSKLNFSSEKKCNQTRKQLRISDEAQENENIVSTSSKASSACYVKLMQLCSNQMFGLSELIFNNNKNIYKENFTFENLKLSVGLNMNDFESDQNLNSRNLNSYVMICDSDEVEYYVLNKSIFLNNMNDTEKFFFRSQIENMVRKKA